MPRPMILLLVALAACEQPHQVAVQVTIPGPDSVEAPVAGVGVVALPYDRDSVLAAMEARAPTPRPHTAELDSLYRAFRGPFIAFTQASHRSTALRDTLAAVKQRLDSLPRNAPTYAEQYARFGALSDSLAAAQRRTDLARATLDSARTRIAGRMDSLRTRVRHWEDSTYRGYDSVVASLARTSRLEPVTDTTGADGWAEFELRPGRWWIYARSWDAQDPNSEWYWNVPAAGDTIRLGSRTGRRQARY